MQPSPQNVTDYPNNDTYFLVWNFREESSNKIKSALQRVCTLVINLNNWVLDRFPKASCVMEIGYYAWLRLNLLKPLYKELKKFEPIIGNKHTAVATKDGLHFHIRADEKSLAYDMSSAISNLLKAVIDYVIEVQSNVGDDKKSCVTICPMKETLIKHKYRQDENRK